MEFLNKTCAGSDCLFFSQQTPQPVPDLPQGSVQIDPVALVGEILNCYKSIEIAKEEQKTWRMQIREQSRVCIAAIEANTKEFALTLAGMQTERKELIQLLCDTIRQNNIDEYSLKLCTMILEYLSSTNPLNSAGKALQAAPAMTAMIGTRA